jgi:hypothetical protein
MQHNPVRRLAIVSALLLALGLYAITPATLAYGSGAQWQIGASGTCNVASVCASVLGFPPGFTGGFWGWCDFGGSSGSSAVGTTGTKGDCQFTVYLDAPGTQATNPYHVSQDVTSWMIATGSAFLPPGTPGFFITGGTLVLTGPGAPGPTGVTIPLGAVCNLSNIPTTLVGNPACDTGIPAAPGHVSLHPAPGVELNIQVTQIA